MSRVKYLVIKDSFFLLKTAFPYITWPTSWNGLVNLAERCSHDFKITPVHWSKPPDNWIKINSDGSALANSRMGAGGIMRNKDGDFMLAYSTPLGHGSNN